MKFSESITLASLERDPYEIYKVLREEEPIAWVPVLHTWLATRWEDVKTITKSPLEFSAEDANAPVVRHFGSPAIIHADGETHSELRKGIAPYYKPGKVADYIDDLVRPIAMAHVDKFRRRGRAELMSEYFEPVSVLALGHTFGLGEIGSETLIDWFHGLAMGAINFSRDPLRTEQCDAAKTRINIALDPILTRLEREPDGTPLSHLLHHSMPANETRSRDFIMPSVFVTLLGGMQEPGHGAASTLFGLMKNPDQMKMLIADPAKWIPKAVQEGIRWIAPIGTQGRMAAQDIELAGMTVPKGSSISAVIASANRDSSIFTNPDIFDMARDASNTATFGFGPHFCAGKWFSQSQMEIMLEVLFDVLGEVNFAPKQSPEFFGWEFRAPTSLEVTFKT